MADAPLSQRLQDALDAAKPHIRRAAEFAGWTEDSHQRWTAPGAHYDFNDPPYSLISELDRLSEEAMGSRTLLFGGTSFGSAPPHCLRIAMTERIVAGVEPKVIARDAVDLFASRTADVLHIVALDGVELESEVDISAALQIDELSAEIKLEKSTSLPASDLRYQFFAVSPDNRQLYAHSTSAALTFKLSNRLVAVEPKDAEAEVLIGAEIARLTDQIVCSCALSGSPTASVKGSFDHVLHPTVGYAGISPTSNRPILHNPYASSAPIDPSAFIETLRKVRAFKSDEWSALRLAIDRYRRSCRTLDLTDKALDLGVAIEVLLLHGEGGDNNELRYKIGTRGALLVAQEETERLAVFHLLKKAYDARSAAAHAGSVDPKKFSATVSEAYIPALEIARKILDLGRFPEWGRVALGLTPLSRPSRAPTAD